MNHKSMLKIAIETLPRSQVCKVFLFFCVRSAFSSDFCDFCDLGDADPRPSPGSTASTSHLTLFFTLRDPLLSRSIDTVGLLVFFPTREELEICSTSLISSLTWTTSTAPLADSRARASKVWAVLVAVRLRRLGEPGGETASVALQVQLWKGHMEASSPKLPRDHQSMKSEKQKRRGRPASSSNIAVCSSVKAGNRAWAKNAAKFGLAKLKDQRRKSTLTHFCDAHAILLPQHYIYIYIILSEALIHVFYAMWSPQVDQALGPYGNGNGNTSEMKAGGHVPTRHPFEQTLRQNSGCASTPKKG